MISDKAEGKRIQSELNNQIKNAKECKDKIERQFKYGNLRSAWQGFNPFVRGFSVSLLPFVPVRRYCGRRQLLPFVPVGRYCGSGNDENHMFTENETDRWPLTV